MTASLLTTRLLALAAALAPVFADAASTAPAATAKDKGVTPLTLERVFGDPPLQGRLVRQAEISPDGAWVSYLRPSETDSDQLELWAQPTAGGAPRKLVSAAEVLGGRSQQLTEAERMALERKRISQGGITGYQWCGPSGKALLFPLSGDLYLVRLTDQGPKAQRLTADEQVPEQDPTCSPDGSRIAYVKGGELWVQPLDGGDALMQGAERHPAVTAVLLSYDCESWIGAALDGVLAQDYPGPLEIVVSDDASRDASFEIVRARAGQYRGRHHVVLKRRTVAPRFEGYGLGGGLRRGCFDRVRLPGDWGRRLFRRLPVLDDTALQRV